MEITRHTTPEKFAAYTTWLSGHPKRSLWQSLEWKQYQEALGKEVRVYTNRESNWNITALVVIDTTTFGLTTWEIPYGPLWTDDTSPEDVQAFLAALQKQAKQEKCMTFYYNPSTTQLPGSPSNRLVYPEASIIVDITQSEEDLLAQMKPKGRYNIKVAEKNGVTVRRSNDANMFAILHQKTAERDGFITGIHKKYQAFTESLPGAFLLLAFNSDSEAIAGLLGVVWEDRAIYYYGASDHSYRALMAPYALQWAAMRHAKERGCTSYGLFGIAPKDAKDHPWAGITKFKEKFGGEYAEFPKENQTTLRPFASTLLNIKRKILG